MEGITLGDLSSAILFLAGLFGGVSAILVYLKKGASKWISKGMEPVHKKLDSIQNDIDQVHIANARNYIIHMLARVRNEGYKPTDEEKKCFWDNYDKYTEKGANSYVHTEVERARKEGLL